MKTAVSGNSTSGGASTGNGNSGTNGGSSTGNGQSANNGNSNPSGASQTVKAPIVRKHVGASKKVFSY